MTMLPDLPTPPSGFEPHVVTRGRRRSEIPQLNISSHGLGSLNHAAVAQLGYPEYVRIAIDRKRLRVSMTSAPPGNGAAKCTTFLPKGRKTAVVKLALLAVMRELGLGTKIPRDFLPRTFTLISEGDWLIADIGAELGGAA